MAPDVPPPSLRGQSALGLRNEVRRLGYLELRPGWYTANLVAHTLLLAAVVAAFLWTKEVWLAPLFSYAFYQLGLLYHDFGHYQAYPTRAQNDWAGQFVGLLIGGSISRWRRDHDVHHAHTNDLTKDPDLEGPLAHTAEDAGARQGFGRLVAQTQHLWILPISCLALMPIIRTKDILFVLTQRYRRRTLERAVLATHYAWYFTLVFGTLPVTQALLFIAIHQTGFGALFALAFIVNHTGMPVRQGKALDPIGMQIQSTRNVKYSALADYLLGPLAPHIEHHVFPGMPRCNQRQASQVLRAYARNAGITYKECGVFAVHGDFLTALRALAQHAKHGRVSGGQPHRG